MTQAEQFKMATLLGQKPSLSDYARIGGRTALEGGAGAAAGGVGGMMLGTLLYELATRIATKGRRGGPRPMPRRYGDPSVPPMVTGFLAGTGLGGAGGAAHGFTAARSNMRERNQGSIDRMFKRSSFLRQDPSMTDYGRIAGRTALQGAAGGYGSGAAMALLLGLISKRFPGSINPAVFSGGVGGAVGLGGTAAGIHGFRSAKRNMQERLGPVGKAKRLFGK